MNKVFVVLGALTVLSGCAGVPEHTFNPGVHAIESIAVAAPQHDDQLLLRYRKDQLESIDLLTPIPVAKVFTFMAKENREAEFTDEFEGTAATFTENLQQQLQRLLVEADYSVTSAPGLDAATLRRDRHGLLRTIPAAAFNGSDALLETSGEIGFTAAGRGKPFQPTLWLTLRLTATDGEVLLQDQILFNPPKNGARGVLLYPSGDFKFADRQSLLDSDRAAEALTQAITAVTNELVFLLRGPVYAIQQQ